MTLQLHCGIFLFGKDHLIEFNSSYLMGFTLLFVFFSYLDSALDIFLSAKNGNVKIFLKNNKSPSILKADILPWKKQF